MKEIERRGFFAAIAAALTGGVAASAATGGGAVSSGISLKGLARAGALSAAPTPLRRAETSGSALIRVEALDSESFARTLQANYRAIASALQISDPELEEALKQFRSVPSDGQ